MVTGQGQPNLADKLQRDFGRQASMPELRADTQSEKKIALKLLAVLGTGNRALASACRVGSRRIVTKAATSLTHLQSPFVRRHPPTAQCIGFTED